VSDVPRETNGLITRENCVLIIIDVQEKLIPAISDKDKIVENVVRLANFAQIVGLPVILTEQLKLGPTLQEVKKGLPIVQPVSKTHFNCFYCKEFSDIIERLGRKTLILSGVEAHICVAQTAIDGLSRFNVHVIGDAVSSRTPENRHGALERMKQAGAVVSSTEMFIYEILQKAGTDEFKAALQLVK